MDKNEIVPLPSASFIQKTGVSNLLEQIRPSWQSKALITRVKRIFAIDQSSACQRLFNAAIHDLREKIIVAGIDIAREAAKQNKLPPVEKPEDIYEYSTAKLINLAYKIGLLSRPEWRRVSRCYEIRRDLEHEDDEYEAGIEDSLYIFKTCIEVILARDPIHLLRVEDVKVDIEQPVPIFPSETLLNDYEHAPQPRQEEISRFLMSIALDPKRSEIVRQNAFTLLGQIQPRTQRAVKLRLAEHMQERIGRRSLDRLHLRVAHVSGVLPYLRQSSVKDFFVDVFRQMEKVGYRWTAHEEHGELLRSFQEIGGLLYCPVLVRPMILKWLILAYIGERGGRTSYGHVRNVFYSNTAEPLIVGILEQSRHLVADEVQALSKNNDIKRCCSDTFLARRYEALLDIVDTEIEKP
jgi:hypothetical protein